MVYSEALRVHFQVVSVVELKSPARLGDQSTLFLLDEPFAGVDPIAVIEIQRIVRFLKERNIGV